MRHLAPPPLNQLVLVATVVATTVVAIAGCEKTASMHDASGVFEAQETIIAAEIAGQLQEMPITEGQRLNAGAVAARIDCKQLQLQKEQAQASNSAIGERTTEAKPQLEILRRQRKAVEAQFAVQQEQLTVLEQEKARFTALVAAKAAPARQLTDIAGQIAVLQRQMASTQSQIAVLTQRQASHTEQVALQNRATTSEREPLQVRIAQLDDQITKCSVINPLTGTVLAKYAEQYEFATPGKPLYRIADLSQITLRAYITGNQLGQIKLNQPVKVFVDDGPDAFRELEGTLAWVSDKAEFTPKTIQTKDERSNLVYAIKIRVPNDGSLKIGMYGEVTF